MATTTDLSRPWRRTWTGALCRPRRARTGCTCASASGATSSTTPGAVTRPDAAATTPARPCSTTGPSSGRAAARDRDRALHGDQGVRGGAAHPGETKGDTSGAVPQRRRPGSEPVPFPHSDEARAALENGPGRGDAASKARCARCRQGFFCSDHAASAEAQAAYVDPNAARRATYHVDADVDDLVDVDPLEPRTCRNAGCCVRYTEAENADDASLPSGTSGVHGARRGGRADVHVYDFDEFMRVPPCGGSTARISPKANNDGVFERDFRKI